MKTIKVKVERNAIYWTSVVLNVLFAWLIFPIKWIRRWRFNMRKHFARKRAMRQSLKTKESVYVSQWGEHFFVGTRRYLRNNVDKIGQKVVKRYTNSHVYDVDFRKSLVAKYRNGVEVEKQ